MTAYRHTQIGTLVLVPVGISVILLVMLIVGAAAHPIAVAVAVLLLVCIAIFPSLTVEVTDNEVRVRFGLGPIGKTFSDIGHPASKGCAQPLVLRLGDPLVSPWLVVQCLRP